MKLLSGYVNGNYKVYIFNDGTKVRTTNDDSFISAFPESIDLKITNQCDMGCPYCHENSTMDGLHGDILNLDFIDTLHPFTEIAIGGGDPMSHPNLIPFLRKLKANKIIANMTIHQSRFEKSIDVVRELVHEQLIHGIGISVVDANDSFIGLVKEFKNAVLHIINGVITPQELAKLYDKDLKILILGYKYFRRGCDFYDNNVEMNKSAMHDLLRNGLFNKFKVVSFDNLAITQLELRNVLSPEEWEKFYMGDDATHTMYIDAVNEECAGSSVDVLRYSLRNNIGDMFNMIRRG